ncbi:Cat28 [Halyomorpha halys]|nr:Cat28 [Halyomorpha halys]
MTIIVNGSSTKFNYFESIIEKVNSAGSKWNAGHNFDPNTPLSHLKRLMGVKDYTGSLLLREENHVTNNTVIPDEFDSRKNWPHCPTIGQIRDQGNCGSCWAVSAAAVVSDRYCIVTNGNFTLPLSDEQLLSCCKLCGSGCEGGYPLVAWKYIVRFGIVTGGGYKSNIGCQPYDVQACDHHVDGGLPSCKSLPQTKTPKCQDRCTNPSYNSSFDTDHHKVERAYTIKNDVAQIQQEILLHGPVEAALIVYTDLTTYKSGVYHHVTGHEMGPHAVRIIGWGVEDKTPYWLVANSWNTHWGDKGFFKILRGTNHCRIESLIFAGIPVVN